MTAILRAIGRLCVGPRRTTVFLVALVTVVIGFAFARTVQIGDALRKVVSRRSASSTPTP